MPWRPMGKEVSKPAVHQPEASMRLCLRLVHSPGTMASDLDARASVTV